MKKIALVLTAFVLVLSACKTTKQPAQSEYTSEPTAETKVFTVPGTSNEAPATTAPAPVVDEKPISIRKEQVSFTDQKDQSANAGNTFFVILGSFSQLDNAKNARGMMLEEGFTPIILHSETGFYRVCVNSFKKESDARSRVSEIRNKFPKYADLWLLIKE